MIPHGDDEQEDTPGASADVIAFPYSRVTPPSRDAALAPVTYGALAQLFGVPREQTTGHWCSRCQVIWYGYLLEVTCPTCGNRQG